MIELQNVTKYYKMKGGKRHYVLDQVSLEIPANKSLAILGPNGAGKSTLLRLIGGAEAPNSGRIITEANISWPLGLNVGFQGSLSGRQNIQFVCDINGLTKKESGQIISEVQAFAEIGDFFDMPVKSYSSGMRARLGFGLSINFEFDYYLIDELTSVGDAIFREKAQAEFLKIKEKASLVFVAHNVQTLRKSCDSALFLHNGKASYYENIEDGIAAYDAYIEVHYPEVAKKAAAKKAAAARREGARRAGARRAVAREYAAREAAAKKAATDNAATVNEDVTSSETVVVPETLLKSKEQTAREEALKRIKDQPTDLKKEDQSQAEKTEYND